MSKKREPICECTGCSNCSTSYGEKGCFAFQMFEKTLDEYDDLQILCENCFDEACYHRGEECSMCVINEEDFVL